MNGTSKYDVGNGIHRVPLWRIAGYALNNSATNLYMFFMGYVAYYLNGFVGMAAVLAGSFSMMMRIWDGVTDPFVGYLVDRTSTRFGKNRPFIVIGQVILCVSSFILFHVTHMLPENVMLRSVFFIVMSMVYYIGYTFQCVVTKSAQTCVTNDPKQRPLFSIFDGIYNLIIFSGLAIVVAGPLYDKYDTFVHEGFFHDLWLLTAVSSAICTAIAVISITPKDNPKYFGTGKVVKVGFKDYWDVLKNNRAIQMLVLSASTDKLGSSAKTTAVTAVMFGVVVGNFAISGGFTLYTSIANILLLMFGVGVIATRLGQRKAMLVGSWGALIGNTLLVLLWTFGDPTTFTLPGYNFQGWNFFSVALLVLTMVTGGLQGVAGGIVIPMTADCADYEVYRSGRYVPGLMGTLFSFVDKVISSLAPMIAGVVFAMVGYADKMPDMNSPYSDGLKFAGIFLMYGLIIVGLLCNVIAMKFYPLTKEKMEEIQGRIAEIKEQAMKG